MLQFEFQFTKKYIVWIVTYHRAKYEYMNLCAALGFINSCGGELTYIKREK